MNYSSLKNYFLILPAVIILSGCTASKKYEIENLDTAKKQVQHYYESGQHEFDCEEVIDDAIKQLEKIKLDENSMVVFDIDETALSNYVHTKEIGFGFIMSLWNEWMLKADAQAIPQTKRFYNWLIDRNVHVVFVTGRHEEVREATLKNLKTQGYTKYDTLIMRQPNELKIPAVSFKSLKREELSNKGYNIVACIGDQWSDLAGGDTGIKIKLPNYLYWID